MQVALVRWPDDAAARESLRQAGQPRVLLVSGDEAPPVPVDDLEDWIRMPISDADLQARVEWLSRRLSAAPASVEHPVLDDDGLVRTDSGCTALAPVEARLVRALIARYGAVVTRDALADAVWPGTAPDRNNLDAQVSRLRRRLLPIGLAIRTVRNRGYLLERSTR